jgi:protein TonB
MLEDCLIESRSSSRTKKPLTLVVSVITHGSLVAGLVLIPLFQEQLLPKTNIFEPLRPPEVRTNVTPLVSSGNRAVAHSAPTAPTNVMTMPPWIPPQVVILNDLPQSDIVGVVDGGPSGPPRNGFPWSAIGVGPDIGSRTATPPPPPPRPTPPPAPPKAPDLPPPPTGPVAMGGKVMMSSLIHQVQPVYPVLAAKSGTYGTVNIEAVITKQGTIDPARLRVLSGHILLNQAAVDAVLQWRYKPTTLNGETVEVITTIVVNFTLNR